MQHTIYYAFIVMALVLIGCGIPVTMFAYEDPKGYLDDTGLQQYVEENQSTFQIVGPILIGVGVVILSVSVWQLMKHKGHSDSDISSSDLGFQFY